MRIPILCTLLFTTFCSGAFAANKTLVVGVEAIQFHPHYWLSIDQQFKGYASELFEKFGETHGYEIVFKPYPPEALLAALIDGEVDMKYPDHPAWGSSAKEGFDLQYSEPVVAIADGSLVNPRRHRQGIDNVSVIGTVSGFSPWVYSEFIDSGRIEVRKYDSLKNLTRAAIKNEVDAVYFNVIVATYFIDNLSTLPFILEFDDTLPFVKDFFHVSTVNHPEVVEAMNEFLSNEASWLGELKDRYGVEKNLDNEYLGLQQWKINYQQTLSN